jgi:hypothetical protein
MKQMFYLFIFIFISCEVSDLRNNQLLDYLNPRAITDVTDFEVLVYDEIQDKNVDVSEDIKLNSDNFQIYLATKLFNPLASDVVQDIKNNIGRDRQSRYHINLKSKNYVYIDNFDSLFIDSELEINNVSVNDRNLILTEPNLQSYYLTFNNPHIAVSVSCEMQGTGEIFLLQNNDSVNEENLKEVKSLGIPFKLQIELHLISGEDIKELLYGEDGTPTGFYINPNNQVRYRFHFTIYGIY